MPFSLTLTTPVSNPFIDTNVLVAYLSKDDPSKQAAAAALFDRIGRGELVVYATDTVIADCVYVLSSPRLYRVPRDAIADMLLTLVRQTGFQVSDRQTMTHALQLYGYANIKFDDAYIIASMSSAGSQTLYSWDKGFDRIPGIDRMEP